MAKYSVPSYDEETDSIHLLVPLTPSGNEVMSWHRAEHYRLVRHRKSVRMAVWAAVGCALGYVPAARGEHWATRVELSIVRCSDQRRRIDDDNLVTGCKYARDAIVKSGIVIDDNPGRITMRFPVEDRATSVKAKQSEVWGGWHGPATHLIVYRMEG